MTGTVSAYRFSKSLTPGSECSELPNGYHIVPFSPEQHSRAVHLLLVEGFSTGGGQVADYDSWWHSLSRDGEYDPALVFILAGERRLAAAATCWTTGFVKDLVVAPAERRNGLASALLHLVFRTFRDRGADCVSLKVERSNEAAISLYRSVGMECVDLP